jgi:hypothetical protein
MQGNTGVCQISRLHSPSYFEEEEVLLTWGQFVKFWKQGKDATEISTPNEEFHNISA